MTSDPNTAQGGSLKSDPSPAASNNATGIFATQSENPPPSSTPSGGTSPSNARPFASENAVAAAPAPPLPVVHQLVINQNSAAPESSEAMLNLLRSPAAARLGEPGSSVPTEGAPAANGGFTQLLQSLNSDPPAPSRRATAEASTPLRSSSAPEPSGGFTQLLQTLDTPALNDAQTPGPASPEEAAPPFQKPASKQVTSFDRAALQAFAPKPEPLAMPAPVAQAHLGDRPMPVHEAGSFTQLFQTLGSTAPAPPEPNASRNTLAPEPAGFAANKAAPAEPSFTQLFRTLDSPAAAPMIPPSPDPASPFTPQTARTSGSFAQPFQAEQLPPPLAQAAPETLPRPAIPAQSGSFTQLFQTEPQPTEPSAPRASAGAFTQLFGALGTPLTQPQPPVQASPAPLPPAPVPFHQPVQREHDLPGKAFQSPGLAEPGPGVSQVFSSFGQATPPAAANFAPREPSPFPLSEPPSPKAPGGGLTQLLQTLDGVAPAERPQPAPSAPAPPVAPGWPPPGSAPAPNLNFAVPPPLLRAETAAPSEFTQILQASMLREAALRGDATPAPQSPAPVERAPIALPPLPAVPKPPSVAVPAAVTELKTPTAPAAQKPLQQHLPLLLVLIIFLLVAILIAVIVLMKR